MDTNYRKVAPRKAGKETIRTGAVPDYEERQNSATAMEL